MHKMLLKEANEAQLHSFLDKAFDELKYRDEEMYKELEMELYKEIHGCHFSKNLLEKALSYLVNEDGTKGAHWNIEDTNSVAKGLNVNFVNFNEYDWCYVMNMLYSDYYGVLTNDPTVYGRMAIKFLNDKDAPEGKALKYYFSMK